MKQTAYQSRPVDLDDVLDRLPTDGALSIPALLEGKGAIVTHAHVAARVEGTVRDAFPADAAFVVLPDFSGRRKGFFLDQWIVGIHARCRGISIDVRGRRYLRIRSGRSSLNVFSDGGVGPGRVDVSD